MLVTEGLGVRAGGRYLVREVSVVLKCEDCALLTGPSGAGKTTLAHCLAGFIPHARPMMTEGVARVDGTPTAQMTLPQIAARVALVLQRPEAQLFSLLVADEIAFAPRNLGLSEREVAARVATVTQSLGIERLIERAVPELSGGEKQRVAVASVLAMSPRILILDEPLSQLDETGRLALAETLGELHRGGMGLLAIEQHPRPLLPIATRELRMNEGRLVADGPPADRSAQREAGWERMVGPLDEGTCDELLALKGVSVRRQGRLVLDDVDLRVRRGEVMAVVGPNGSGKTTLALLMAGLLRPSAGKVTRARRLRIGLAPQDPQSVLLADTVAEEVRVSGRPGAHESPGLLARLGLEALADQAPSRLSSGEARRLAIAATLAGAPELMILDEPAAGLHEEAREAVMSLAAESCRQGAALLVITHDAELVRRHADRVVVLREGRVVADGRPLAEEVSREPCGRAI